MSNNPSPEEFEQWLRDQPIALASETEQSELSVETGRRFQSWADARIEDINQGALSAEQAQDVARRALEVASGLAYARQHIDLSQLGPAPTEVGPLRRRANYLEVVATVDRAEAAVLELQELLRQKFEH